MKRLLFLSFLILPLALLGQKFVVEKSEVQFFSDAAIEDIAATNVKGSGIIDISRLEFAFSVPIAEFDFEKSLMKEHFNEKYMESDKFPHATFTGKIEDFQPDNQSQNVKASGKLKVHGVSRDVVVPATMEKYKNGYRVYSKFVVRLEDYDIKIPQLLFKNIAESVEVTVDFYFKPQSSAD